MMLPQGRMGYFISIYLSINTSIYQTISLSIYLSIYLSIELITQCTEHYQDTGPTTSKLQVEGCCGRVAAVTGQSP